MKNTKMEDFVKGMFHFFKNYQKSEMLEMVIIDKSLLRFVQILNKWSEYHILISRDELRMVCRSNVYVQRSRSSIGVRYSSVRRRTEDGDRNFCVHRASTIVFEKTSIVHRPSGIRSSPCIGHRASELHRASGIDHRLCFLINATKKSWKKHHL